MSEDARSSPIGQAPARGGRAHAAAPEEEALRRRLAELERQLARGAHRGGARGPRS